MNKHMTLTVVGLTTTEENMLRDFLMSTSMLTRFYYFTNNPIHTKSPIRLNYAGALISATAENGIIPMATVEINLVQKGYRRVMTDGSKSKELVDVITPPYVLARLMNFVNDVRAALYSVEGSYADINVPHQASETPAP